MADAEQAARTAGDDDTADELRIALERIRDRVACGDEAWRWAQELARDTLAAHVGQRDGGTAEDDTALREQAALVMMEHHLDPEYRDADNHAACVCGDWTSGEMSPGWDDHLADVLADAGLLAAAAPRLGADTVRWMHDHTIVAAYDGGTGDTREVGQAVGRYDHPTYVIRLADGSRFVWSEQLVREATEDERATYAAVRESVRVLNQADQGSGGSVPRAPVEALLAALERNPLGWDTLKAAAKVRRHLDGDT